MQQNKLAGFDYLRAIFAIVVVTLHVNLFVVLTGKAHLPFVAQAFNQNIGYLAVPVFFQVALFLFYIKSEKGPDYFLQKRLPKLVTLFLFWTTLKLLFDLIITHKLDKFQQGLASPGDFIFFVISGGQTVFYFFFSLIVLTTVAEGISRLFDRIHSELLKHQLRYLFLFVTCTLTFSFPWIHALTGQYDWLTSIPNPLSFLPYVFTTSIALEEFKQGKMKAINKPIKLKLWSLFYLYLVFTLVEKISFHQFPHYSRLSLVFGSWLLLYLALLVRKQAPGWIQFLSGCSLGIYALHVFFSDHTYNLESLSVFFPGLGPLMRFVITLAGSIGLTLVLRRIYFLKAFV